MGANGRQDQRSPGALTNVPSPVLFSRVGNGAGVGSPEISIRKTTILGEWSSISQVPTSLSGCSPRAHRKFRQNLSQLPAVLAVSTRGGGAIKVNAGSPFAAESLRTGTTRDRTFQLESAKTSNSHTAEGALDVSVRPAGWARRTPVPEFTDAVSLCALKDLPCQARVVAFTYDLQHKRIAPLPHTLFRWHA